MVLASPRAYIEPSGAPLDAEVRVDLERLEMGLVGEDLGDALGEGAHGDTCRPEREAEGTSSSLTCPVLGSLTVYSTRSGSTRFTRALTITSTASRANLASAYSESFPSRC